MIRWSSCTAASSASARRSRGRTISPRSRRTIGCWRSTCWASVARRKSSTSTTAAVCGSATSRGSARPLVSSQRTSWATRWARSICSSTPPRTHRCCPCAAWSRSAAAARSNEMNIRPRSTTTTPRLTVCDGSCRPFSTTRRMWPMPTTCSGDMSRASHLGHGRRWRPQGFGVPVLSHRRFPRACDSISASTCRRWWSRVAATSYSRGAGPRRSPGRSHLPVRR